MSNEKASIEKVGSNSPAALPDELSVSMDSLRADVLAVNSAIDEALNVTQEFDATEEEIRNLDYKEVKRIEQSVINDAIKKAEEARKALKRRWEEPLKLVTQKYDDAIKPATQLHVRYRNARLALDEEFLNVRKAELEACYDDFLEANGLSELKELLPFYSLWERSWGNRSTTPKKAESELTQKVSSIIADWESLKKTEYHYPEEAQSVFFQTLSLRAVNEHDAQKWEEMQALEALNAQVAENQSYQEEVPRIVAEAEEVVAEAEDLTTYIFAVDLTLKQFINLRNWFKSQGIHGIPMKTSFNGYERAATMVKAVCNG